MSLNVLSDASIVKIFDEIDDEDCAQLICCSFRFSNVFNENITMPKREAYEFRLFISRNKKTKKPEYGGVAVKWMSREIEHREERGDRSIHNLQISLFFWFRLRDGEVYYDERRHFGPTDTYEDAENELLGIAKNLLLTKVSSFRVLTLSGFTMSNTLVNEIRRSFSCYSPLEGLVFSECEFPHNSNNFSMLMDMFMPKNLYMDKSANNVNLTDLHLARTPTRLWIGDGRDAFTIAPYESIGDQSITNWIYKTPEKIKLTDYKTNITLEAVVKFIQVIVKKYSFGDYVKEREFHFGSVRWNNDMIRSLMMLHRTNGLKISHNKDRNWITYKHLSFNFAFSRPIFRITEQQARNKLQDIRRQAEQKRNEMPNYSVQHDLDLLPQLENCKEQLYHHWAHLYKTYVTIYNGAHAAENFDDDDD